MILQCSVQFGMPAQWHHEFTASLPLLAALGHKSAQSEARFVLSPEKTKSLSFKLSKVLEVLPGKWALEVLSWLLYSDFRSGPHKHLTAPLL